MTRLFKNRPKAYSSRILGAPLGHIVGVCLGQIEIFRFEVKYLPRGIPVKTVHRVDAVARVEVAFSGYGRAQVRHVHGTRHILQVVENFEFTFFFNFLNSLYFKKLCPSLI